MCRGCAAPIHEAVGVVVDFPHRRRSRYEAAALDRLLGELDRRRELRAVAGESAALPVAQRFAGKVIPFRIADR